MKENVCRRVSISVPDDLIDAVEEYTDGVSGFSSLVQMALRYYLDNHKKRNLGGMNGRT